MIALVVPAGAHFGAVFIAPRRNVGAMLRRAFGAIADGAWHDLVIPSSRTAAFLAAINLAKLRVVRKRVGLFNCACSATCVACFYKDRAVIFTRELTKFLAIDFECFLHLLREHCLFPYLVVTIEKLQDGAGLCFDFTCTVIGRIAEAFLAVLAVPEP